MSNTKNERGLNLCWTNWHRGMPATKNERGLNQLWTTWHRGMSASSYKKMRGARGLNLWRCSEFSRASS